jgi:hypothetical protein
MDTRIDKIIMAAAAGNKPPAIRAANRRLSRILWPYMAIASLIGLVFPSDWANSLGPIALPLEWTARIVPSIEKAAAISPLGDLVRGYLAFLFSTSFLMILVVVWRDPLVERFKYAFTSGNMNLLPRILFVYGLGLPALLLGIWAVWSLPGELRLGLTPTRGQAIFSLMLTNRVALALFSTFIVATTSILAWLCFVCIAGPIAAVLNRD